MAEVVIIFVMLFVLAYTIRMWVDLERRWKDHLKNQEFFEEYKKGEVRDDE